MKQSKPKISQKKQDTGVVKLSVIVVWCLIGLGLLSWTISIFWFGTNGSHEVISEIKKNDKKHFVLILLLKLNPVVRGILSGTLALLLSWLLTYFNWEHVGNFPATPLSPNQNNNKLNQSSTPAIISAAGLGPLIVGITTGYYAWQLT